MSDRTARSAGRDSLVAALRAAGCVRAEDEAGLLLAAAAGGRIGLLADLLARRVAGEPLEHVVGWAEFDGLRVRVSPGVFVPRARSVLLVRVAADLLADLPDLPDPVVVVDLCAGSGALGLAVARRTHRSIQLHAVDLDPVAVADARVNLAPLEGVVHLGDLFAALTDELRGRLGLVLCNAPYVPSDRIRLLPREARTHEARVALEGGPDGLTVHRRVLAAAPRWLAPGGHLLVEVHESQVATLAGAIQEAGLRPRQVPDRDEGTTVVVATRPANVVATGRR